MKMKDRSLFVHNPLRLRRSTVLALERVAALD